MTRLVFLIAGTVLFLSCQQGGDANRGRQVEQKMDSLFSTFTAVGSPGCAVVVSSNEEILFSKGYGLANVEHQIPISSNTVFDIASVSKQFTAYAAATLIEQGRLSPHDNIRQYFPELQIKDTITVAHLIHHTSGLRDWPQTLAIGGWSMEDQLTYEQILRMAFLQKELNYPPGSSYSYTNTGYVLLAELISRVVGQPFHEYIRQLIFEPLGMEQSSFNYDIHTIIPHRAQSYHKSAASGTFVNYADNTTAMGSSSMFSTAEDLAKWLQFLNKNRSSNPVVQRMYQKGVLNNGDSIHYAYGLWQENAGGLPAWVHTGSWSGFRIMTMSFPTENLSIIMLSNTGNFDRYGYADQVASLFLGEAFQLKEEDTGEFVSEEEAVRLTGVYLAKPHRIYEITHTGGRLQLLADGALEHALYSDGENVFRSQEIPPVEVRMHASKQLIIDQAEAVALPQPTSVLNGYEGIYYSDELQATYEITPTGDALYAKNIRYDSIKLEPLAGDVFQSEAWFLGRVLFLRNANNQVNGLEVFGGRVRRLYFRRVK